MEIEVNSGDEGYITVGWVICIFWQLFGLLVLFFQFKKIINPVAVSGRDAHKFGFDNPLFVHLDLWLCLQNDLLNDVITKRAQTLFVIKREENLIVWRCPEVFVILGLVELFELGGFRIIIQVVVTGNLRRVKAS